MKISIDGVGTVQVGDEFKDMSPDDQNAFVAHITEQHSAGRKSGLPAELQDQPQAKAKYPNTIGGNIATAVEEYVPQSVRDISRAARSGLTFGASDVLPGAFGGKPAAELQAETNAAIDRHPYAGEAAKIGGMMLGMTPVARGVSAGARGLAAVPMLGRMAANPITQAAVTGALTGGAESGIKGEDIGEGAALGGMFGAGGQALGQAVGGAVSGLGNLTRKSVGPTSEALLAEKNAAYDAVKNSGVSFSPEAIGKGEKFSPDSLRGKLTQAYADFGWSPHVNPKGMGPAQQFRDMLDAEMVSPQDIDNLLKTTGNLASSIEPSDKKLGHTIRNTVTEWLQKASPEDAGELLKARSLAAKTIKDRQIQEALEKATKRADQSGRGGNFQNTVRQEIGKLEGKAGWSPEEQAMIREINSGTPIMNMARHISGFAPSTGVLPAAMTVAAAGATGGMSLPASGAAWLVKQAADAATRRKVGLLADLVRSGGQLPPPNAMQRLGPTISPIIARGLLAGGLGGI